MVSKVEHDRFYEAPGKKQISHVSTNMETSIGLFGTLICSYLSSIEATSRSFRKFVKHELYASVMWYPEYLWK